ncbi:hypothetical protein TNIN_265061 [Trichonephila inaurata madagascariensis]|uniref:Uncharacterized protein n=1 Tax=Trichonephila inaurata madagascariensis TaxID=2747483 RepID=A0A8X6K295_9ARAC|nr:hypothetical protein TNIN_265061 [Trichonephila inaurata madagascariensis]
MLFFPLFHLERNIYALSLKASLRRRPLKAKEKDNQPNEVRFKERKLGTKLMQMVSHLASRIKKIEIKISISKIPDTECGT